MMKNLELSCANSLRVGGQSINKAALILIVVQDGLRELLRLAPNHMCLSSVYLTSPHMTKFPGPSPSIFAYCK